MRNDVIDFVENHDFAIVIFDKSSRSDYESICKKYGATIYQYRNKMALRFVFNGYVGFSESPETTYDIVGGTGYFEDAYREKYAILYTSKSTSAKVV